MARKRAIAVLVALGATGIAAGCTGVLGLDETSLRGGVDAAVDSSTTDGAGSDVTTTDSAADAPGMDARPGSDGSPGNDGASDGGSEAAPTDAAPVFTTVPTTLGLYPDASLAVQVSVQRNGVLPGSLSVTFTQLPTGVTSTPGVIAADAGATSVTLEAAGSAPVGATTVDLQANGTTYSTVPLVVFGASGTVDQTFQGGYVTDKADGSTGAFFTAVAIDSQGGIIAGGVLNGGGWMLLRYLPDGTDDVAFDGKAGAVMPKAGTLKALAIDPTTNDIVCVGNTATGSGGQMEIVVLDASGDANGAFNGGVPYIVTPVVTQESTGNGVAIVAGQKFLVAGADTPSPSAMLSIPFDENGTPGGAGPFGFVSSVTGSGFNAAAIDPMGRFIAAGSEPSGPPTVIARRFSAAGSVDSTFGDGGVAITSGFACAGNGLAVRPKAGSIFVSGSDYTVDEGCYGEWTASGQTAYTRHGTSGGGGAFNYAAATPMGDSLDRLYMVGSGGDMFARSAELDRVLVGGGFDPTFGGTGQVQLDPGGSPPAFYFTLQAVAVQPDGRIVVAGSRTNTMAGGTVPVVGRFWP